MLGAAIALSLRARGPASPSGEPCGAFASVPAHPPLSALLREYFSREPGKGCSSEDAKNATRVAAQVAWGTPFSVIQEGNGWECFPLKMSHMFFVDDRDGRLITELERPEDGLRLLETMARDDTETPEYLSIVVFDDRPGAILGTESSATLRPLQH